MAGHTSGPWGQATVAGKNGRNRVSVYSLSNNRTVCQPLIYDEEDRANARLIAAAPELLAAAQTVLAGLNARIDAAPSTAKPVFNGIAELHDAINKATGQ